MSKYIMDILGEVDEKLLEEALDLPQQADEIVLESDERRRRGSIFGAAAAIAASLAIAAGVVLFRANFGKIAALPNDGGSAALSGGGSSADTSGTGGTSDDAPSGIVIPNEFTEEDRELQRILNDIGGGASEVCMVLGYYPQDTVFNYENTVHFLFPQMAKPITFQFDKYPYFSHFMFSGSHWLEQLTNSFTEEAAAEFTKDFTIGKGVIINADETDLTVSLTEGGEFDENGYLIKPPKIIELEDGSIYADVGDNGSGLTVYRSSAKVISRTDDEIIFSYIYMTKGELFEEKGRLLNENGWKFSWYGGWIF